MINLRQYLSSAKMTRFGRQILASSLVLSMSLPHAWAQNQDAADGNQENKEGVSESYALIPRNVKKDKNRLDFELVDSNGESVRATFENKKEERWSLTDLRTYMTEQEAEVKRQVDFIRRFIERNIKDQKGEFYKLFLGTYTITPADASYTYEDPNLKRDVKPEKITIEPHFLVRDLVNDYFVLEFYKRLPRQVQDEIYRQYEISLTPAINAKRIALATMMDAMKTMQSVANGKPKLSTRFIVKQSKNSLLLRNLRKPFNLGMHGLPAQTGLFSGVIGLVIWQQLSFKYHENPLAMIQHLESLKDPIAHISFYTFMAMNGFTNDLLTKRLGKMEPSRYARGLKMGMPYIGMTAGMLASALTPEILGMVKNCASNLLNPKEAPGLMERLNLEKKKKEKDPCDQAMDDFFNFENKVEQFIPMFFSMALSTAALTGLQAGYAKVSQAKLPARLATNKIVKAAGKAGHAIKLVGFQLLVRFTPIGWVMNSLAVKAFLINVAHISGFVYLDHMTLPWITKKWAQLWRAGLVALSDLAIKNTFFNQQRSGWNLAKDIKGCEEKEDIKKTECQADMRLALEYLHNQMEMWRSQNHAKFFTGTQSWSKMMSEFIQEYNTTEKYYKFYVEEVFRAHKYKYKRAKKEAFTGLEERYATFLPFRKTPLYGVEPLEMNPELTKADMYLLQPNQMQEQQLAQMAMVADALLPLFTKRNFEYKDRPDFKPRYAPSEDDLAVWSAAKRLSKENFFKIAQLLSDLKTTDLNKATKTILHLNHLINGLGVTRQTEALDILLFIRNSLGDPNPILADGMAMPYAYAENMKETSGLPQKRSHFRRYTEYLTYQMFCGPQNLNEIASHSKFFGVRFHAPSLISQRGLEVEWAKEYPKGTFQKSSLCTTQIPFEKFYYSNIFDQKTGQRVPFLTFLNNNIRAEILGNFKDTRLDSTSNVNNWWDTWAKKTIEKMFAAMDFEYQKLLVELAHSFQPDGIEWVDGKYQKVSKDYKATDASRSLLYSNLQEANVYLSVIADLENFKRSPQQYAHLATKFKPGRASLLDEMNRMPEAMSPSQQEFVGHFRKLITYLQSVSLRQVNGQLRVALPQNGKDRTLFSEATTQSLGKMREALAEIQWTPYQAEVLELAFEGLNKNVGNLTGYLLNIQLTNFSALNNFKDYVSSNQNMANTPGAKPTKNSPFGGR